MKLKNSKSQRDLVLFNAKVGNQGENKKSVVPETQTREREENLISSAGMQSPILDEDQRKKQDAALLSDP